MKIISNTKKAIKNNWPKFNTGFKLWNQAALFFVPGVFFLLIGISVVFAPRLLLGLVAGFFLACGILFCYAAYRFIQLRREMSKTFSNLRTEIRFHVSPPQAMEQELPDEIKKIIYH